VGAVTDPVEPLTIGELARRTGLSVRTIRFWSDSGILGEPARSAGGYRLYDLAAVTRLELVRTLRELGIGLDLIQRILDRPHTLADVAALHVAALDAEIRTLRQRRAVLRVVADHGSTPEEMMSMHSLIRRSAQERQRVIDDFVAGIFAGVEDDDALVIAQWMRELPAELPDEPTRAQAAAWVELAELVADNDFGATLRRMVLAGADDTRLDFGLMIRPVVLEHAGRAVDDGIMPGSDTARAILDRIVPADLPTADVRTLADWLESVAEPRVERYWQLLSLMHGRIPDTPAVPAFEWLRQALLAHR
jgi:DNA-binding transcriptional MerR regulator